MILRIEVEGLDALLLRSSVIVLRLYLKEIKSGIDIGTYTNLLTREMACLMTIVHLAIGRIKV